MNQSSNLFKRNRPTIERMVLGTSQNENGCWLLNLSKSPSGHCVIGYKGLNFLAHRLSWEFFFGSIPKGKQVLHKCIGNGNCWNPKHLYLGNDLDNARDRVGQGRQFYPFGEKNHKTKLTSEQVLEIKRIGKNQNQSVTAARFGVKRSVVSHILNGHTWSHI